MFCWKVVLVSPQLALMPLQSFQGSKLDGQSSKSEECRALSFYGQLLPDDALIYLLLGNMELITMEKCT